MTEYGIFNDEGCVEAGFYSMDEAQKIINVNYVEDDVVIAEICPEHEGNMKDFCDECC